MIAMKVRYKCLNCAFRTLVEEVDEIEVRVCPYCGTAMMIEVIE